MDARASSALRVLDGDIATADFDATLAAHHCGRLVREETRTLQINVGKLCNQACHHCHVDAGPKRTEMMTRPVAERIIELLDESPTIEVVDITGGAPELNPNFRWLVERATSRGCRVIDRCNLTVLYQPGMEGLPEFLAHHQVEIVASLPCYTAENVDKQRGRGVFERSIQALQLLNRLGYGMPGSELPLNLVYNPLGPSLAPPQERLEKDYKYHLRDQFGIEFHQLFALNNMPIHRFAGMLSLNGEYAAYMSLLVNHFSAQNVPGLMCRSLVSVSWEGALYDCDFNQMLELGMHQEDRTPALTIWNVKSFSGWAGQNIRTASHCFGCTAGSGSGCGGALS
ncbi:MAG TPA: arsenosugar biosynthesis radical SAM (seleno)protein ArsS [Terriglobia bacterium]|nr:arsenosugar biosynthesis radical SAM (seleno)protein ArsS [Terriglobia bacterium]